MKMLWLSPYGDGWSIAAKIRDAGHKVILVSPAENQNGVGYLPKVALEADWLPYAMKSDVVVVDNAFPSRRTKRSWNPSNEALLLTDIKRKGVPVMGPLPTMELLENDERYARKILQRFALPYLQGGDDNAIRLTLSTDGQMWYAIWRHRALLGGSGSPGLGNLGDLVLKLAPCPLTQEFQYLVEFAFSHGKGGYFNLSTVFDSEGNFYVEQLRSGFLYPAIFGQFPDLLSLDSDREHSDLRLAVTLLQFDRDGATAPESIVNQPGFFGGQLHREDTQTTQRDVFHGVFVGALAANGPWPIVQNKIYRHLGGTGLTFREDIGSSIVHDLELLKEWGWLSNGTT